MCRASGRVEPLNTVDFDFVLKGGRVEGEDELARGEGGGLRREGMSEEQTEREHFRCCRNECSAIFLFHTSWLNIFYFFISHEV